MGQKRNQIQRTTTLSGEVGAGKACIDDTGKTKTRSRRHNTKFILTLTRCCTQFCNFCAVDAIYSPSVAGCVDLAHAEQIAGREIMPDQWCDVAEKLLAMDPTIEFDLSGGDCLALPWVSKKLIPFILERVQSRYQVSFTSNADSLRAWLAETRASCPDKIPGAVHVTFDGCRHYSFDNIRLANEIHELGMEMHVECPLTAENCNIEKVQEIYYAVKDAHVNELLLIRFFPVGRGGDKSKLGELEPSARAYKSAIAEFFRLENLYANGPAIKVQCALKQFEPEEIGSVPCKMGDATWCVMPNGALLLCPWAYGTNGHPLSEVFVAGNVLHDDFGDCLSRARGLRDVLRLRYPRECRILAFIEEPLDRIRTSESIGACLCN